MPQPILLQLFSSGWVSGLGLVLILLILGIQGRFWFRTRASIQEFRDVVPSVNSFSLLKTQILKEDAQLLSPRDILSAHADLRERQERADPQLSRTELTLVQLRGTANATMTDIRDSINTYLIRNKGAVADFNLLRDIVQRHLDAVEEGITLTMPIPLYLGLMGTMLGIVLGLFAMPSLNSDDFLKGEGVNSLIDGVKMAMVASFVGLGLTVWNTVEFRNAKAGLEGRKHGLFTFLQTELLPLLTESVNAGVFALNRNLDRFGSIFAEGLQRLDGMVDKNFRALTAQQQALDTFRTMDLSRIATFNAQVLQQLTGSLDALERFGLYLDRMNDLIENTRIIVERTGQVERISEQISGTMSQAETLFQYLSTHFRQLDAHSSAFVNHLGQVDDRIVEAFRGLDVRIRERLRAIEEIRLKEEDQMVDYFQRNRDKLGKLDFLERLQTDAARYQQADGDRQAQIQTQLRDLSAQQAAMNALLLRLVERMERGTFGRLLPAKNQSGRGGA